MNRIVKLGLLSLALAVAPLTANAGANSALDIQAVADQSGLTVRNVEMLFGHWSAYAGYRFTLPRVQRTFIETFGEERYRDLMAGKPVQFERMENGRRVVFVLQRQPAT